MRIALDAMGGDNAPYEIVWGGVVAAAQSQDSVILVGDEGAIRKALRHRHPKIRPIPDVEALLANGRLSILHTDESIAMDDAPAAAVRRKKNCSINVCMRLVKEGKADAAVSAGNSGAMAASALFVLGRIKGVARPAIATVLPSKDPDRPTLLLDAGANTDCHHEWLREFAVMGDIYSRLVLGREKPVVGLMSIGTEDSKGNELTKHAFPLLRDYTPGIAFRGNVEGHDVFEGKTDVIVCDGFIGNVILKTSESAAHAIGYWLSTTWTPRSTAARPSSASPARSSSRTAPPRTRPSPMPAPQGRAPPRTTSPRKSPSASPPCRNPRRMRNLPSSSATTANARLKPPAKTAKLKGQKGSIAYVEPLLRRTGRPVPRDGQGPRRGRP